MPFRTEKLSKFISCRGEGLWFPSNIRLTVVFIMFVLTNCAGLNEQQTLDCWVLDDEERAAALQHGRCDDPFVHYDEVPFGFVGGIDSRQNSGGGSGGGGSGGGDSGGGGSGGGDSDGGGGGNDSGGSDPSDGNAGGNSGGGDPSDGNGGSSNK